MLEFLTVYLTPDTGELDSAMQEGDIMGHEAIGIVDGIGLEVETVEKGDRVIILPVSDFVSQTQMTCRSTRSAIRPILLRT